MSITDWRLQQGRPRGRFLSLRKIVADHIALFTMGMVVYERVLDLRREGRSKSLFLFGSRQTGKTFLLHKTFPDSRFYDLLLADVFLRLSRNPQILREEAPPGGSNFLGGRARACTLFPLGSQEIPEFNLMKALDFGTIPSIYLSEEPEKDLAAYCGSYLRQEIQAEGLVRRIDNFSKFLHTASLISTELINVEALASEAAVPARTVREYFRDQGRTDN